MLDGILRRAGLWAALWAVLVLTLTLIPAGDMPQVGWAAQVYLDKWVHAFLFGVQGVLLGAALAARGPWAMATAPYWWALLLAVLFGAVVEVLQEQMGLGRHADLLDLLADAVGALSGLVLLRWRHRRPA